jgi:hypothetical protein
MVNLSLISVRDSRYANEVIPFRKPYIYAHVNEPDEYDPEGDHVSDSVANPIRHATMKNKAFGKS